MKYPISVEDRDRIWDMLSAMECDLLMISCVVGPVYGTKMMDAFLRIKTDVWSIGASLERIRADRFYPGMNGRDAPVNAAARREIRQRATIIIEPVIAYEAPVEPQGSRGQKRLGRLQFREHIVIGSLLMQMRTDLTRLFVNRLQYAYGKTDRICRLTQKVLKRLDGLRSDLDSKVCGEYPLSVHAVEGVRITHAYYGGQAPHFLEVQRDFLNGQTPALRAHDDFVYRCTTQAGRA